MILVGVVLFGLVLLNWIMVDRNVRVLKPGGDNCAMDRDMYEKSSRRCKVSDRLALGYLNGQPWVRCGEFAKGAQVLRKARDANGNYWYKRNDKHTIAFFYTTCQPTCASATDRYRTDMQACDKNGICDFGMCQVGDLNAVTWMDSRKIVFDDAAFAPNSASSLYSCDKKGQGLVAIQTGTFAARFTDDVVSQMAKFGGQGQSTSKPFKSKSYFYDPSSAQAVRNFYSSCSGPCACNDIYDVSAGACVIADKDVRAFFDKNINNGQELGSRGKNVQAMNAHCRTSGVDFVAISDRGQLEGNYKKMTYSPFIKHHMRALYSSCARHVACA